MDKYDVFIGGRWDFLNGNWSAGTSVTIPFTFQIALASTLISILMIYKEKIYLQQYTM